MSSGPVLLVMTIVGAPVLRHAFNRQRITKGEAHAPMAGDDLVRAPRLGYTRAVTIDAPPDAVWPWLAQTRQRLAYPPTQSTMWHVIEPVNFVMERKMLLGIKSRAERMAGTARSARGRRSARP